MAGPGSDRVGIVGGGIVGLAVARRLLNLRPGCRVTVLEKEAEVARHQTGRNSGVAHAGLYYAPGSLKATLCRRGVGLLKDFCAQHGIPYDGVRQARGRPREEQAAGCARICERAAANGVPDLAAARADGHPGHRAARAEGCLAIHSPRTAIVDFAGCRTGDRRRDHSREGQTCAAPSG